MIHYERSGNVEHTIGNKVLYFFFMVAGWTYDSFTILFAGAVPITLRFQKLTTKKFTSNQQFIHKLLNNNRWSHHAKKRARRPHQQISRFFRPFGPNYLVFFDSFENSSKTAGYLNQKNVGEITSQAR
jgi:hypothetical protein